MPQKFKLIIISHNYQSETSNKFLEYNKMDYLEFTLSVIFKILYMKKIASIILQKNQT